MAKGLDNEFVNYGIRNEDLDIIKALCEKYEIDFNWLLKEILGKFHAMRVEKLEMTDLDVQGIVEDAIALIK